MTVTRKWIESLKPGSEKKHWELIMKEMVANDEWAFRGLGDLALLITSHPGNRPFLKACVESFSKINDGNIWKILCYDNYWDHRNKDISYDKCMPNRDVFDKIDTTVIPHVTTFGGVLYPYSWLLYHGSQIAGNFKYVVCINGDLIVEKPEGFKELFKMFKESNADVFPCGWQKNNGRPLFNTTMFLSKTKALQDIMKHFMKHLIGIDTYEKYAEEFGNTEGRFARACHDLNLKVLKPEENPVNTQLSSPGGTFYKIMGLRHIHAEFNTAYRKKGIPPEPKYFDGRYLKGKVKVIKDYYNETDKKKKQKILERFWAIK